MKTVIVAIGIFALAMFIVWNIQDSNKWHPEIPEYNSSIP
jgi:hypothetical protein